MPIAGLDPSFQENNKNSINAGISLFFIARVISVDTGSYVIQVAPAGQRLKQVMQGIPMSSCLANAVGFKEAALPQVGSYVFCYKLTAVQCLIIGVIPQPDEFSDKNTATNRTVIGAGHFMADEHNVQGYAGDESTKVYTNNNGRPIDVTENDRVIGNDFGVLLGLFQTFATLKASELAQVQVHLLDDLVRVISHNFQHHHALGEYKIYHDGKGLHIESGLTDSPKEALGLPETAPAKVITHTGESEADDTKDFYKLTDDRVKAIERLKIFVGKLGELVNVMLVKPADDVRILNGKPIENFDKGLFQFQLHKDGGAFFRSRKGITFEKTNWIRDVQRIRSPEDPAGDNAEELEYPDKEAFKFDDSHTFQGQPFLYFTQIRDYLAYMQDEYAYKNFKTHEKDFQVSDDFEKDSINGVQKVDPLSKTKYEKRSSGFTLMPNGGITLFDAWGSAIVMEGGNIYIQPARDLITQPLRNHINKVGGHFSLATKRDIDISSTQGSMRLKTDRSQHFYSENSGIVLQSDGQASADYGPEELAVEYASGIVLKATNNGINSYGKYKQERITERAVSYAKFHFQKAEEGFTVIAGGGVDIQAKGAMTAMSDRGISLFAKANLFAAGESQTTVGMEDQTFGVAKFGVLGKLPVQGYVKTDNLESFKEYMKAIHDYKVQEFTPNFREDKKFEDLKFRYLSGDRYGITDALDAIPLTMAQQEDFRFSNHTLQPWEEKEINGTYPYPGKENENLLIRGGLINLVKARNNEIHNRTEGAVYEYEENAFETINIFKEYKTR